ncbi:MAG: hypothetical protein OXI59_17320, partial [Gemmatimonadota bacterium]|nr:hypothetical protein [Gemmatimonadota bacterium]
MSNFQDNRSRADRLGGRGLRGATNSSPVTFAEDIRTGVDVDGENSLNVVLDHLGNRVTGVESGQVFLPEANDPNQGLEIKMQGADSSWVLATRAHAGRTLAQVDISGSDSANFLTLQLPAEMAGEGLGNDWSLLVQDPSDNTHPAQKASVNVQATARNQGLTLRASTAGADGNNLRVRFLIPYGGGYPTASWNGDLLTVTTGNNQRLDALISVINAARRNGNQVVEATRWNNANTGHAIDWLYAGTYDLRDGQDSSDTEPASFAQQGVKSFILKARETNTLSELQEIIGRFQVNGVSQLQFDDFLTLTGDGTDTISATILDTTLRFSQGADAEPARLSATVNEKTVTLLYETSSTFADLIGKDLPTGLSLALVRGTGEGQKPVAPGFSAIFDLHTSVPPPATNVPVLVQSAYRGDELIVAAGNTYLNGNDTRGMRHMHDVLVVSLQGTQSGDRFKGILDLTYNVNSVSYPSNYYLVVRNGALVATSDGSDTQPSDWREFIGNQEDMHVWESLTVTNVDDRSLSYTLHVPDGNIGTDLIAARRTEDFRIVFGLQGFDIDVDSFTARIAVQTNQGAAIDLFNNKTAAQFVKVATNDYRLRLDGPRLTTPDQVRIDDLFVRETRGYNLAQSIAGEARVDGQTGHTWHSLTESLQHVQFF